MIHVTPQIGMMGRDGHPSFGRALQPMFGDLLVFGKDHQPSIQIETSGDHLTVELARSAVAVAPDVDIAVPVHKSVQSVGGVVASVRSANWFMWEKLSKLL